MIEVRTFGHIELTTGGGDEIEALIAQPMRFALFCYLALPAPGTFHRRDTLLAMFWPEADHKRARASLRQSLAYLRRILGEDVLMRCGDEEIGLNPELVWCDAAAFSAASERGSWAEAVGLYRGEFLKAFFLSNVAEFEQWLEGERARLAGLYRTALEEAGKEAVSNGDWSRAVEYYERLVGQDRFNSRYAMRLMEVLAAAGDPANALVHAKNHAVLLREELDVTLPAEMLALEERIRHQTKSGGVVDPRSRVGQVPALKGAATATSNGGSRANGVRTSKVGRRSTVVLVGTVLVVAAAVASASMLMRGRAAPLATDRVVVTPFRNETDDSSLNLVGRLAGHWVTQGIQRTGSVQVLPWETALQTWLHLQQQIGAGRAFDPVQAMAEATGAGIVISGTLYLDGGDLRINVDVNDATHRRMLGSVEPVQGPRDSLGEIVTRLQQHVMGFLAVRFDERLAPTVDVAGTPPTWDAYRAFNEGMERWIAGQDPKPHFRRAIELDTTYAEALLYLAIAFEHVNRLRIVDSLLNEMNRIRVKLTPYYVAYAEALQAKLDGDLEAGLLALRRAAEMAPGSRAWHSYGVFCVWTNRPQEAVRAFTTLNPESEVVRGNFSTWQFLAGALHTLDEHERELELARRFREVYPNQIGWALQLEAEALAALGRIEQLEGVLDELANASESYHMRRTFKHVVETLIADDRMNPALNVAHTAVAWYESRQAAEQAEEEHRRFYGEMLFLTGRHDEAQTIFDTLVSESEYPYLVNHRGMRALVAAARGDSAFARADEEWLAGVHPSYVRWHPVFWRAVVVGALGRRDEAIELLRQSEELGMHHFWYDEVNTALNPLHGYGPFEQWLRPKG